MPATIEDWISLWSRPSPVPVLWRPVVLGCQENPTHDLWARRSKDRCSICRSRLVPLVCLDDPWHDVTELKEGCRDCPTCGKPLGMLVCSSNSGHDLRQLELDTWTCPHKGCGGPVRAEPFPAPNERRQTFGSSIAWAIRRLPASIALPALIGALALTLCGVAYTVFNTRAGNLTQVPTMPPAAETSQDAGPSELDLRLSASLLEIDRLRQDLDTTRNALRDSQDQLDQLRKERDASAQERELASEASRQVDKKLASLAATAGQSLAAQALILASNLRRNGTLQTVYRDVIPKLPVDRETTTWLDQRQAFLDKSRLIETTTFSYYLDMADRLAGLNSAAFAAAASAVEADFTARHLLLYDVYWPIVAKHVQRLVENRNALSDDERQRWEDEISGRSQDESKSR